MPFYQTRGLIPPKRHTVFKRNVDQIYYEELISREGFSSVYSNAYHLRMPTRVIKMGNIGLTLFKWFGKYPIFKSLLPSIIVSFFNM